jgi:Fuc2NAc and GlcNAc transferase
MLTVVIITAVVLAGSMLTTSLVLKHAIATSLLDVPNARSSHQVPTPRGGGMAIVVTSLGGVASLFALGIMEANLTIALLGGGAAVAVAGSLDDRGKITIGGRMALHFAAAIWAVAWIGGISELQLGPQRFDLGIPGRVLTVFGIVWTLNLFNFMDGIDGIAGSEAVFVALVGGLLAAFTGLGSSGQSAAFVLVAATLGFLVWNWPPARIFMGDVGSGYLGYFIAVLALATADEEPLFFNIFLILMAAFVSDSTLTLVRRLARREKIYQAHRTHAYQRLARRWGSHKRVTLAVIALNLLWLAPLAWACAVRPAQTALWIAAAYVPTVILALVAGSGGKEH